MQPCMYTCVCVCVCVCERPDVLLYPSSDDGNAIRSIHLIWPVHVHVHVHAHAHAHVHAA